MNDDSGWVIWVAVIAVAVWLTVGGGWVTVKGWLGQDVYPDQVAGLEQFSKAHRIGNSADVWLVKSNFLGEAEKVTLFFGYWDDWSACTEFAAMYMQRYPADSYSCQLAN